VLLSDGGRADLGPLDVRGWLAREDRTLLGSIHRTIRQTVQASAAEIARRFPRILRRVSGYNLDALAAAFTSAAPGLVGLHQLVVGSEGTLAIVTEAELNLVPRPAAVGLLIPQFNSLDAALDALAVCLEMKPSAVELLDQMLLELAAHNLFNPGKVVHAPPMTDHLRLGPDYHPVEPETLFDYTSQEGFARAVELCNGAGVCRKLQGGTMCPSFRATRDEKDSTRGRANALRLALTGDEPLKELRSAQVHAVLDLCLMCKACKSECPSNVDMAKLKAEVLHLSYRGRQRPLGHRLMANVHRLNRLGAPFARLVNRVQQSGLFRWLLESAAGIDRRRSLPELHADHFRLWFAHHPPLPRAGSAGTVLLLDDCFTTFNEPHVGRAAVQVLEAAGYAVRLLRLTCCARPLISKGYLTEARQLVQAQAPRLAARLADGIPLLGLEPSCLLTLADEWPELVPGPTTRLIARAARLADAWLAEQLDAGRAALPLNPLYDHCVVHGHCHQKALVGTAGTAALLRHVPHLDVRVLDTGCCGMAGSFGFEKDHYDISLAIARHDLLPALHQHPQALVVAPGTSCRHQIKDLTPRRALHPLEVIANRVR
jgi:Fe-S oxidoreductase